MTNALCLSARIYRRLLTLYPGDLRREFGAEMALVFADDLEAACHESGMWGAVRVWRCALGEFFRFALPGLASTPVVRVPSIWFALSTMVMSGETALAIRHHSPNIPATPFHAMCAALTMPCLGAPLAFLAALWASRRVAISLQLSHPDEEDREPCSKCAI